jgi:hypothetical protein
MDKRMAHVIDAGGVTEAPFAPVLGGWTNEDAITLKPGAVLDFGQGLALTNPDEPIAFTYTLELGP